MKLVILYIIIEEYCKQKALSILKSIKKGVDPPRGNPINSGPPPSLPQSVIYGQSMGISGVNSFPMGNPQFQPGMNPQVPVNLQPEVSPQPAANLYPIMNPQPPTNSPQVPMSFPVNPQHGTKPQHAVHPPPAQEAHKRKVDLNNPYNEMGKIIREHPKYFEIMGKAQKLMENCLSELCSKNYANAKKCLEESFV